MGLDLRARGGSVDCLGVCCKSARGLAVILGVCWSSVGLKAMVLRHILHVWSSGDLGRRARRYYILLSLCRISRVTMVARGFDSLVFPRTMSVVCLAGTIRDGLARGSRIAP